MTLIEFFDKDILFNIMNTKGAMEVLTFNEIMNKNFSKEQMK